MNNKKEWTPPTAGTRVRFSDGVEGEVKINREGTPFVLVDDALGLISRHLRQEGEGATTGFYFRWTRCEPTPTYDEAKVHSFHKLCLKDTGRNIDEVLSKSGLKYWGAAMENVEKNYVGRGRKSIATMYVSSFYTFADTDRYEINPSLYPMDNAEVRRRRRIRYLRNLCCKNKSTQHLTESGWTFWEKVMQNVDAVMAKPGARMSDCVEWKEWKTGRISGKSKEQFNRYSAFLRSFNKPVTVFDHAEARDNKSNPLTGRDPRFVGGVDYAKCPDKTAVSNWVPKTVLEAVQAENEILQGKVKEAGTRRVEMQAKLNKVSSMFLDAQFDVRMMLEDATGMLLRAGAKISGYDHFVKLRKLITLKLPE